MSIFSHSSFFCRNLILSSVTHPFFYFIEGTVLWRHDAVPLGSRYQKIRNKLILSSSRVWGQPLDPWRWRHKVPSKRRICITQFTQRRIPNERSENLKTSIIFLFSSFRFTSFLPLFLLCLRLFFIFPIHLCPILQFYSCCSCTNLQLSISRRCTTGEAWSTGRCLIWHTAPCRGCDWITFAVVMRRVPGDWSYHDNPPLNDRATNWRLWVRGRGERGGPLGPNAALLKLHLLDCRAFQLLDTRTASRISSAHKLVLVQAEAVLISLMKYEAETHSLAYV